MKKLSVVPVLLGLLFITACQSQNTPNPAKNTNSTASANVNSTKPVGTNANTAIPLNVNTNQRAYTQPNNNAALTLNENTNAPAVVSVIETEPLPVLDKVAKPKTVTKPVNAETSLYSGSWFDIQYPVDFTPTPTEPRQDESDTVQTDEAYFASPEGDVVFFVYSPLWGGDPENYLDLLPTESIVSEKTDVKGDGDEKQETRWVTLKDNEGAYYRSYVSVKYQNSQLHHVFGIDYQDAAAYAKYKDAYVRFKNSLIQYAD